MTRAGEPSRSRSENRMTSARMKFFQVGMDLAGGHVPGPISEPTMVEKVISPSSREDSRTRRALPVSVRPNPASWGVFQISEFL